MATPAQATSVRNEVVVNAPVERAFAVFTEQMDRIKPREHNMLGVDIEETVFEQRAGGRIYDRGTDGSECEWATVLAYEPPTASSSAGTSRPTGRSGRTPTSAARSRCGSSPRMPSAPASSWSTVIWTVTARAGKAPATASPPRRAGGCTSAGTQTSCERAAAGARGITAGAPFAPG